MNPSPPLPEELDGHHPWQALKTALRWLWRMGWQSDPRVARRFLLLYGSLLAVLLLLGEAFLLIALAFLRAFWLALPLYPGMARWLNRLGWPVEHGGAPAAVKTPWRRLHTVLWVLLIGIALAAGGWLLFTRGFCGQNLICLTLWVLRRAG